MTGSADAQEMLRKAVKRAGGPVLQRVRAKIGAMARFEMREEMDNLHHEVNRLRGDVDTINTRIDELWGHIDWLYSENRRMAPHVAAQDSRLAKLEDPAATEPEAELVSVEAEHARVRARLDAIARYEERIARLEESAPKA